MQKGTLSLDNVPLLGYSLVTCLPAVHKRDDLRAFACFLISPRLRGGVFFIITIKKIKNFFIILKKKF